MLERFFFSMWRGERIEKKKAGELRERAGGEVSAGFGFVTFEVKRKG